MLACTHPHGTKLPSVCAQVSVTELYKPLSYISRFVISALVGHVYDYLPQYCELKTRALKFKLHI